MFLSHSQSDQAWASWLADRLEDGGLNVFAAGRDAEPGDVLVQQIEAMLGQAATGLLLIGVGERLTPAQCDEYAALLLGAQHRGLRLIPVLHGQASIDVNQLAAGTVPIDLRSLDVDALGARVRQLATVIRTGQGPTGGLQETLDVVRALDDNAPASPPEPNFVVTYARSGASLEYGRELTKHLSACGLPAWSIADLVWGDRWIQEIRDRIKVALGLLVVMSPQAEQADSIAREILEGQRHGKPIFPVLVEGQPLFLLASSWFYDARDGRLPGSDELEHLRTIRDRLTGERARTATPNQIRGISPTTSSWVGPGNLAGVEPPQPQPARQHSGFPVTDRPRQVAELLGDGELELADLMTTSVLLAACGRSDQGWLRGGDGSRLERGMLTDLDRLWTQATHGRHGLSRQQALFRQIGADGRDFPAAAHAVGWRIDRPRTAAGPISPVPRYPELVAPPVPDGFFPTLRNPQLEDRPGWYDRWRHTVVTVHTRYREWSASWNG
ncbi:MAG: hypothetical protein QG608_203 [Actinomycetota bacterium]|nr:hypothetical protein [Actinomycetota bacterium]